MEGIELPNHESNKTHGEKEDYKFVGMLKADTIKKTMKEKNKKRVPRKNKKTSRNQAL